MLAGRGLFERGVFSAAGSTRTYAVISLVGVLLGVPLSLAGVHYRKLANWDLQHAFILGGQFNYWGSIPLALAWAWCRARGLWLVISSP
jgi:uncharacterized protein